MQRGSPESITESITGEKMSGTCRCEDSTRRRQRQGARLATWAGSGLLLVLLPKCPACLAVWITAVTGVGVSVTIAGQLRVAMVAACAASLIVIPMMAWYRRGRRPGWTADINGD